MSRKKALLSFLWCTGWSAVVLWIIFGFVALNWNMSEWTFTGRGFYALGLTALAVIYAALLQDMIERGKP